MTKIETVKDIELFKRTGMKNQKTAKQFREELKEKALKFFLHGAKKRKNPYSMFMEFHNITEEDLEK